MANRKLQGEIDRVLKKIAEGLEQFEELFDKTVSTTNPSQKEKMEQDLKKEIKKLQRLRDQIKTWLTSSEIKDKSALLENRRLIEQQMERFKVLEREIKTKQYSKEGLQAKEKLDPLEVAKGECANWITGTVDKISTQMDAFEAEMEQIKLAKGRRKDTARLAELEHQLERHKFHISKLETMLRMLENDALSVDDVETVKDSVEYYVDSNQEPDFLEDEEMYDHLDLLEDDIGVLDEHHIESPEPVDEKSRRSSKEEETSPAKVSKSKATPTAAAAAATTTTKAATAKPAPGLPPPQPLPAPKTQTAAAKTTTPSVATTATKSAKESVVKPVPPEVKPVEPVVATKPELSFSKVVASKLPQQTPPAPLPAAAPAAIPASTVPAPGPQSIPHTVPTSTTASITTPQSGHEDETMSMKSFTSASKSWSNSRFPSQFTDLVSSLQAAKMKSYGKGDEILRNQHLLQILESSFQQCPDLIDGERPQPFHPTHAAKTPPYYPQKPFLAFDMPTVFEKLDLDTLFFIFYYQQGTRQQYLAARELKRQSWRFHKKYLTWFQRHEEPKAITEEYEQGTYIYFDYEGAWCQRKKSEFTFEYRYLEDE